MLANLLYGLPVVLVCLMLQSVMLALAIRFYFAEEYEAKYQGIFHSLMVIAVIMLILVIGNLAQIGIWAGLFLYLGEFGDMDTAFYHSAVNFATLGYGDIVMSQQYRLLGPLEAINGILMVGVSTAGLTLAFQDIIRRRRHELANII